ncbi:MAG: NfeD family protein [Lachnospiraceae bacterium]|jgi:membrane protein implicated in regulation of membrane protease activity|nr:NfeD family protein [Lachnospiraceae bacterium]
MEWVTNPVIVWLAILIILVVIEIFTLGLTTIWFAGGALVAILVAALGGPVWLQIIIAAVVSAVLLFFTRPIAMKYFNRDRERTNAESLVGRQAIVISEINNLQGIGQVTINGMEWTARSIMDDHIIEPGEVVIVRGINGVKLLVEDRKDFEKKEEQLLENNMN